MISLLPFTCTFNLYDVLHERIFEIGWSMQPLQVKESHLEKSERDLVEFQLDNRSKVTCYRFSVTKLFTFERSYVLGKKRINKNSLQVESAKTKGKTLFLSEKISNQKLSLKIFALCTPGLKTSSRR